MDKEGFKGVIENRIKDTKVVCPGAIYKRLCEERLMPFQFIFGDYGFFEIVDPAPKEINNLTEDVDAILNIDWVGRDKNDYNRPILRLHIDPSTLKIYLRGPEDEEGEKYDEIGLKEENPNPIELLEQALIDFADKIIVVF